MRRTILPLLLATVAAPGGAADIIPTATSHHIVQTAAGPLAYEAVFEQHLLVGADGKPAATVSTTAYLRDGVPAPAARPVFFLFNGGPGASSSPLQFDAMGPQLKTPQGMVDNPDTPLDRADLVFIDPVGTGFSRVLPGGDGHRFWSIDGDAAATLETIRGWLKAHHRETSPVYIGGESYGGTRLAAMLPAARDLPLAGLLLVSPALSYGSDDNLAAVLTLPSMAIAAAANGKAGAHPPSNAALFDEATRFATCDYAHALMQGSRLPPADAARIAARASALIGIPAATLLADHLRIDAETFRAALRHGDGLVVGRLDSRVTAPVPVAVPGRPSAANDPALGLGRSNVIVSKPIGDYLRGELGVRSDEDFVSLTLDVNFQWRWPSVEGSDTPPDLLHDLSDAMRDHPRLRMVVVGGYYDLAVPLLVSRYAIDQAWLPAGRARLVALETGHAALEGEQGRRQMHAIVASLLPTP